MTAPLQVTPSQAISNITSGTAVDDCVVLIVDRHGEIQEHTCGNPDLLGADTTSLRGQRLADIWSTAAVAELKQRLRQCVRRRATIRIGLCADDDGNVHHEVLLMAHGRDRALLVCRDVSEKVALDEHVHALAFRDPLTGLPNRAAFLRRLGDALSDARLRDSRVAIMRLVVDGFRFVNHTLGRSAGNQLVRDLAQRLRDACAETGVDLRLARTAGEEYMLLVPGAPPREQLADMADAFLDTLAEPFDCNGSSLQLSASIGIAEFPQDAGDLESLLDNAGVALHESRGCGANQRRFFTGTARVRSLSRMDLSDELRWALENDQFSLTFQPCFDIRTQHIFSAEALLRWVHPLRGNVPLSEIIPVIAMNDLSEQVGAWVMQHAWEAASRHCEHRDWRVSINLSSRQVYSPLLADRAVARLAESGLPPHRVAFEIREDDFLRDSAAAKETVRKLVAAGFRCILDDAGAGALSVQGIALSGIAGMKLSRSLIDTLPDSDVSRRCCAALTAMGRELNIDVIATGVESAEQSDCLAKVGCHLQQGFLLCPPVTIDELAERLGAGKAVPEPC